VLDAHVTPITRDTPSVQPSQPRLFRDRFWNDGTARLTAYEYLGITQSPCVAGGVMTCNSCHAMHGGDIHGQIEPEMRGDQACTQCHAEIARDLEAHTHHAPQSSGSRCLDCHMPRMVYGVLEIHRSHRIESPDTKRDVEAGRPHACTLCHATESAAWAADKMREWWGTEFERPTARPDGAPLDVPEALASLHAGDAVQRAVYAANLGRIDAAANDGERAVAFANLIVALGDGYPSIRHLARRSLLALDGELKLGMESELTQFDYLAPVSKRTAALRGLLAHFGERARGNLRPPADGLLVSQDFQVELDRVRALLDRQSDRLISIGE
jgi:predicted CXXCH cytochrome family protein